MSDSAAAPANPSSRWGPRIVLVLLAAVVVPVGASVLYTHAPTEYSFLPCLWYKFTGLHCPGCGLTRCVYALMHFDLEQAFAYNPLFMILLPIFGFGVFQMGFEMWTGRAAPTFRLRPWMLWTLLVLLIGFGIARNIDLYPLTMLAPHEINAERK